MFIAWGRKLVRRKLGYVADFCPVCRAQRVFGLLAIRSVRHFNYISLGRGDDVGYERTCDTCRTPYQANVATYASVSKKLASLEEIKTSTYPSLDAATKDRLALEDRVRTGRQRLTPAERFAWIKAPFMFLSARVERRFANVHLDKEVGFSLLGLVVLVMVVPPVARAFLPDSLEMVALVTCGVGFTVVIWQFIAAGPRFMRREILPVLAMSLKPLQPTREELESVVGEIKQGTHKIGRKVSVPQLVERINSNAA
jgi:hypothetical protein